jgi:hypothetical protein
MGPRAVWQIPKGGRSRLLCHQQRFCNVYVAFLSADAREKG